MCFKGAGQRAAGLVAEHFRARWGRGDHDARRGILERILVADGLALRWTVGDVGGAAAVLRSGQCARRRGVVPAGGAARGGGVPWPDGGGACVARLEHGGDVGAGHLCTCPRQPYGLPVDATDMCVVTACNCEGRFGHLARACHSRDACSRIARIRTRPPHAAAFSRRPLLVRGQDASFVIRRPFWLGPAFGLRASGTSISPWTRWICPSRFPHEVHGALAE